MTETKPTAEAPIANPNAPPAFVSPPLPATTTAQEDVNTASQRKVNLIWEITQAFIAIVVVLANMIAALFNVFQNRAIDVPMMLSSALFLIIGFYFSRTNHTAIGGIGKKPTDSQTYEGR